MNKERLLDILKSKIEEADAIVVGGLRVCRRLRDSGFITKTMKCSGKCPVR